MLFKFCIYSKKNRTGQERSLNSFASKKKKDLEGYIHFIGSENIITQITAATFPKALST